LKKLLVLLAMLLILLFSTGLYADDDQSDAADPQAGQTADEAEVESGPAKMFFGINLGVGATGCTKVEWWETYYPYKYSGITPKDKIMAGWQINLNSMFFFSDAFGVRLEVGVLKYVCKTTIDWSNATDYLHTSYTYVDISFAPTLRFIKCIILWAGPYIGFKVDSFYDVKDTGYVSRSGKNEAANLISAGITVGIGWMPKAGNFYFPITLEFKYGFTKASGDWTKNNLFAYNYSLTKNGNEKVYGIFFNVGILYGM